MRITDRVKRVMKLYYDFHIHTALSPCGNKDMTPNNIVNMACISGLNCIAITDHNSYLNIESCMTVVENNSLDLIIIPGMEVETIEEFHVICLIPSIEKMKVFGEIVKSRQNKIVNNEKIFGKQIILDSMDNEIASCENLLITPTNIDIYELIELTKKYDGIAIPAHIDRNSYSIITNLGFIPDDLDISLVEFSKNANPEMFLESLKKYSKKEYKYIIS